MKSAYLYLRGLTSLPSILPGNISMPNASCMITQLSVPAYIRHAHRTACRPVSTSTNKHKSNHAYLGPHKVYFEEVLANMGDGRFSSVWIGIEVCHYISAI